MPAGATRAACKIVVGVSSMMGSVNYMTTIINMRAPGMTLFRMPVFVWMTLVVQFLLAFALPMGLGGLPPFATLPEMLRSVLIADDNRNFRNFLADVLTNVLAEQFALELNGPLSPGVFKPIGDDQYIHVVMPVRTTS